MPVFSPIKLRKGKVDYAAIIYALHNVVKALVRWVTGKRLTNRLPKLILITLSPPSEQRDSWSSYRAVRAYSEIRL